MLWGIGCWHSPPSEPDAGGIVMPLNRPKKKLIARRDPKSRSMNGGYQWGHVRNADPTRHYVAVNMADENQGVEYYSYLGYKPVIREGGDDGLMWRGGETCKAGEDLTNRGHLLMWIDRDKHAELVEHGPDGASGQARADRIENQILDKRGGMDALRGLHGMGEQSGFTFENEIGALEEEPA